MAERCLYRLYPAGGCPVKAGCQPCERNVPVYGVVHSGLLCVQGGFGALLAGLFLPGYAAPLAADLLFVTSPVLFERVFRHASLGAQFFVLAALYFYFAARRKGQYASRGLFALNVLAVGIHPYFLPMTYAITLALLLEYALHNRQLAGPGLYLAANLAARHCWAGHWGCCTAVLPAAGRHCMAISA